jgi:uncharacterized membrane protein YfcA
MMVRHERRAIDRSGLTWILLGRVPGTVVGTVIVASVTTDVLQGFVGVSVLLAVLLSVAAPPVPLTPATELTAGVISGTTGTAAGIGGPPLALLYQRYPGPTVRSTLGAAFLFGTVLSVVTLSIAGETTASDIGLAAGLTPIVVLGSLVGRRLASFVDREWLRPAVLSFAALSAIVVIVDAIA